MTAAAPHTRRWSLARWELRLIMGNGEQALLAFIIPLVLLFALRAWSPTSDPLAAIVTVSALATSFTSLAISTGFERRSGTLRFLATTPLTRTDILVAKVTAQGILAVLAIGVVVAVGSILGERVQWLAFAILTPLGLLAFGSWGFWVGGRFRAEAVLAVANGVFVFLVAFGGIIVSTETWWSPLDVLISALPTALMADGLRGGTPLAFASAGLFLWAVVGAFLARRSFRWE